MALRKLRKLLLYTCAGIFGLGVLLMLAATLALDRVPHYQAQIKEWVHGQIGYHIAFARVSPAFRWYGPELYFDRPELRSKDDLRVLAHAAGGRIGIDLWRLIRSGKLFAGRIELDSPNVPITRIGPNEFALAAEIRLRTADASVPMVKLDELPSGILAIRGGLVTVQNWDAALPVLELRDLDLDFQRGDGVAQLALAARLPKVLGGEISVNATAHGRGRLDTLSWNALARTQDLSLAGWSRLLPDYLSRLGTGVGGFELAAVGRGAELSRADLDFHATAVTTQLTNEPGVKFDQISGALTVTHAGDRWTLSGRRVRAQAAGRRDPESEFDASWRGDESGLLELKARASYLRTETLLPLAGLLPQRDLRERLQEIEPTGEWLNTRVDLARDTAADPWRFTAQARFRGFGFAPAGRAPGLRGLSGTIAGTSNGGRVDIEGRGAPFVWPAQFAQAIDLETFKTTLFWRRTADELLIATPSIELKTHDASLHGPAAWRQPADGSPPSLTLAASVDNGNAAAAHLYYPRALLPPPALAWLNRAFVAGHLSHADVVLRGPLKHFPFRDGTGLFLVRARVDGLTLDYREGWPRAEGLAGVAEFRNEGLTVQFQSGNIGALVLDRGDARFADFKTAELQLHVSASGDASAALDYLRATPLDTMAENAFSRVEARGPVQADVDLFLPFKELARRRVLVHTHLQGVSLNLKGSTALSATELAGDADIDGAQVARAEIRGRLLGGPFQMQSRAPRNVPVTRTHLVFNGTMSGEGLHSALSLPQSASVSGSTDWHAVLRMAPEPARERSLRVTGNLFGLELKLPEPLAKPAGVQTPSTLDMVWPSSGATQVHVALGTLLRGQLALETGANGMQIGRAAIAFGASGEPATFSDTQMLNAGGAIERLDLEGWLKLYPADHSSKPLGSFLRTARFEVAQIDYLGMSFHDVAVDLTAGETGIRIGIGGPNVVGTLLLPSAETEPWSLEFQRLKFVQASGEAGADGADSGNDDSVTAVRDNRGNPRSIPAIRFHAIDVQWGERQLGEVRASINKLEDGVSLQELLVAGASFTVNASGEWRGKEAGAGRIQGTLVSSDVGATLKQLGYEDVIEAKSGKLDFDMNWAGAPTEPALSLAAGHVQVALDKGQITGLKPGAGRVVGLASVAALPRRLALDFSDLTDKGFAFDTVRGDFDLHDGSAYTDDVLVKGPAAEIGLIGRVGLKNKDYDQTAVVTGNVSSSLPLAAFAGGPVIGAAVLVFTQVFKQPLKGLARGYYRITGNWDNPTVERIKSADAAAATAEAPK
jgi:uncharacterized protein (TIGR02099 family)